MWDIDNEVKELGGNPKFFVGDFEKYSWGNLLAPNLEGMNAKNFIQKR